MHREISHADGAFHRDSQLSLSLLTGLIALLIGIDVWPSIAAWLAGWGLQMPAWNNEIFGYRIAILAAILGGARTLYGALDSLLEGRIGADLAMAIACVAALLAGEPLVAAEIVFIGMAGECLESFTFERTQRAIRRIAEVCPRRCWRLREGQIITDVWMNSLLCRRYYLSFTSIRRSTLCCTQEHGQFGQGRSGIQSIRRLQPRAAFAPDSDYHKVIPDREE
jgi:cation transport ATPase